MQRDAGFVRIKAAEQKIHIGEGERAAAAIAGRTGFRAGTTGAYGQRPGADAADGPAAGGHSFNAERGCDDGGLPKPLLELIKEFTFPAGHVGAGAAHIDREDFADAGATGGGGAARKASGRPAQ